jgi:hypothetical protein
VLEELAQHAAATYAAARAEGDRIAAELDAGRRWWDERWAEWQPDPGWQAEPLPRGWETAP